MRQLAQQHARETVGTAATPLQSNTASAPGSQTPRATCGPRSPSPPRRGPDLPSERPPAVIQQPQQGARRLKRACVWVGGAAVGVLAPAPAGRTRLHRPELGRTGWGQPCPPGPRCCPSLKEGEASGKSVPGGSGALQAALFDHYSGKLVMTSNTMIAHLVRVSVSCGKEVRLWSD